MNAKKKIFLWVGVIGILGIGYNAYHWFDGLTQNRIGYVFFKILKNENIAFHFFKRSAEKGNSKGALNLGHCYFCGHGTQRDLDEARTWLLKSSLPQAQELMKQINAHDYACQTLPEKDSEKSVIEKYEKRLKTGDPEAKYFVGMCYLFGIYGKPTDYDAGFTLIKSSADSGNKDGQAALGWCYFLGAGVEQNDKRAFEIFEENAKKNILSAESGLGMCYFLGKGAKTNYQEAYKWTKKAAEGGDKKAAWNLGVMYLQGKGIEKNIDKGIKWIEEGAEFATAKDQRDLGYDYEYSIELMPKNLERAFYWYNKAAEKGLCCGLYSLGLCFIEGKGVPPNLEKGIECVKKAKVKNCEYAKKYLKENYFSPELVGAASAGDPVAQNKLGFCYLYGFGVQKNQKKGFEWVFKAAEQGNSNALSTLGLLYENGIGVNTSTALALQSYKKAAEKGSLSALTKMGFIYTDGKLVQKDLNEAIRWYIKAAESGSSIAQNNLAWILATSKNPEIRDGSKAITWANQAIDNSNRQEASYFGTLAAAYAESGQFSKAIEVQKKAISLIKSNENVESYKSALQSYKEKRPLREDF